ncbi:MAG: 50S ribosomal protein L23 [bacterium]
MNNLILVRPRVSEKAYATSQKGVYVFVVPTNSNKHQIAAAVKEQFNVDVFSVNIVVQKGKAVRFYRAGKFEDGSRSDMKKAYVRLAEGQSIPVFTADEQEAPKAEKTAKAVKPAKVVKETKKGAKE